MKSVPALVSAVAIALVAAACAHTGTGSATAAAVPEPGAPIVPTPESAPVVTSAPASPAGPAVDDVKNYVTYHVKVTGMTCPIRCIREVRDQLTAVTGVLHVEIDFDAKEAIVDVRPGTDPDTLVGGLRSPYAGRLVM